MSSSSGESLLMRNVIAPGLAMLGAAVTFLRAGILACPDAADGAVSGAAKDGGREHHIYGYRLVHPVGPGVHEHARFLPVELAGVQVGDPCFGVYFHRRPARLHPQIEGCCRGLGGVVVHPRARAGNPPRASFALVVGSSNRSRRGERRRTCPRCPCQTGSRPCSSWCVPAARRSWERWGEPGTGRSVCAPRPELRRPHLSTGWSLR